MCMDLYGSVSAQFQAVGSVLCHHLWQTSGDLIKDCAPRLPKDLSNEEDREHTNALNSEWACTTTEQSGWHTPQAHTRDFDMSCAFSIIFIMILIPVAPRDAQVGGRRGFPHLCHHSGWQAALLWKQRSWSVQCSKAFGAFYRVSAGCCVSAQLTVFRCIQYVSSVVEILVSGIMCFGG